MRDFGFKMLIINDLRNLLNILIIECTEGNFGCRTALIKQFDESSNVFENCRGS